MVGKSVIVEHKTSCPCFRLNNEQTGQGQSKRFVAMTNSPLLWQQQAPALNKPMAAQKHKHDVDNSFFITPCRETALVWCFHWRNQTTDVNSDSTWRQHFETQASALGQP